MSWWRRLVNRDQLETELDAELRDHVERDVADQVRHGTTEREARRRTRLQFGGLEQTKEWCREVRGTRWVEELGRDVRIGLRTLRRHPGFTVSVILTLAVGIGANVAIFSVVHAVLIRPFVYPAEEPGRVLLIAEQSPQGERMGVAYPTFRDWETQLESFASLSAFFESPNTLSGAQLDRPIKARALVASSTYFDIHGMHALHGRLYDAADDRPGAAPVLVLSHRLWQAAFGGGADVVGETVRSITAGSLDVLHTIIGVLPPGVDLHPGSDFYIPLGRITADFGSLHDRGYRVPTMASGLRPLYVHGRLKAGVTVAQARAELAATAERFETAYPDTNAGVGVVVDRLAEWRLRSYRPLLWALQASVLLLWLIATINVANLMLARAVTRRRQYAVSAALGAGSLRTLRPLLIENLMLSLAAGGVGLLLALGSVALLRTVTPFDVPRLAEAELNWPVAALGLGLAMLAGLATGLLPGLRVVRRVDVTAVLNEDGALARIGAGGRRLHRGLLVTQVAAATLLLVLSGALIRTVADLSRVDLGFRNDRILSARIVLDQLSDLNEVTALLRELPRRVEALPEVQSAGLATNLPLLGISAIEFPLMAEDLPVPARALDLPSAIVTQVDPGYFDTMGIPLLEGRHLDYTAGLDMLPGVVVTQTLARRLWPSQSALGKRVRSRSDLPWSEIVGVVGAVRQDGVDAAPRSQTFRGLHPRGVLSAGLAIVVQTTSDPLSAVGPVQAAIEAVHPELVAYDFRSMDEVVAVQMAPRRFVMWSLGLFGLIAILIAAVGLNGILAHAVAQRAHELGIRMALGAGRRNLRALVMREGVVTAMAGVLVGVLSSLVAMGLLDSLLLPRTAADPWLWGVVPLSVIGVALVATLVPASRAARTDPVVALRGV